MFYHGLSIGLIWAPQDAHSIEQLVMFLLGTNFFIDMSRVSMLSHLGQAAQFVSIDGPSLLLYQGRWTAPLSTYVPASHSSHEDMKKEANMFPVISVCAGDFIEAHVCLTSEQCHTWTAETVIKTVFVCGGVYVS